MEGPTLERPAALSRAEREKAALQNRLDAMDDELRALKGLPSRAEEREADEARRVEEARQRHREQMREHREREEGRRRQVLEWSAVPEGADETLVALAFEWKPLWLATWADVSDRLARVALAAAGEPLDDERDYGIRSVSAAWDRVPEGFREPFVALVAAVAARVE